MTTYPPFLVFTKWSVNCVTGRQGAGTGAGPGGAVGWAPRLRDSLRRSSARLLGRLSRHSASLPPDVDYADPDSLKRASSLSALSSRPASASSSPAPAQPR
ncbi:hypothetical protein O0L34_g13877 [Tuta absoluta]|nr:hypothetical protein O0L34_g13877 [Tuta absoluta]